jgi:transcriptional regulator with XRE-family HTH domain
MTEETLADVSARAALLATLPEPEARAETRRRLGISEREMARLVGCTRAYIKRFEQGETVPTGERLVALSNFYLAAQGEYLDA